MNAPLAMSALDLRGRRLLIRADSGALPSPPGGDSPRAAALARIVLEECLRDRPLDPSDDFGRRLFLFAEDAEPLLAIYAEHPSLELTLTDAADKALVRRVLRPADYMMTAAAREHLAQGIGPGSEAVLRVHFDTGDVRATGYRLYLFYPS